MTPPRSPALARWWPTTQSMDLVEAPIRAVAAALGAELGRILGPDQLATSWVRFPTIDAALGSVTEYGNVPLTWIALPTRSPWTVLWTGTFLCDGHDSLSFCLTRHHGLRTLHFTAHDDVTTFQPGASFTHRRREGDALVERSVYVGRNDARWDFVARGEPLPEEGPCPYGARRKRDRLNEAELSALLDRLGATPWSEGSYALDEEACFVVTRTHAPATVTRRPASAVVYAVRLEDGHEDTARARSSWRARART